MWVRYSNLSRKILAKLRLRGQSDCSPIDHWEPQQNLQQLAEEVRTQFVRAERRAGQDRPRRTNPVWKP